MRMSAIDGRLKLPLLGGVVVALLIGRIALFSPSDHGLSPLSYEIVDGRGIAEDSLFDSGKNSKLPLKVLDKSIKAAKTPRSCPSAKPSVFSDIFTPFTASAQECDSPCQGAYNRTCNVGGECQGLFLCCYDEHNEEEGCKGVLWYCRNGGNICGQSECTE
jgi:hypothetical protein